jgi:AraC-like DNA-binding protein
MTAQSQLDRLLVTLDVDVQTLAFCELRRGRRLVAPPIDAIMMHYVLQGTMHMSIPGFEPLVCGPGSIALIPPAVPLHVAADDGPASDVLATEHCSITRDGVLFCDIADGGVGDLRYVSGIVLASFSGSFGLFDRLNRPIAQQISHSEVVRHAYSTMLDELARPRLGARALTSALMKACMVLVLRQFIEEEAPHSVLLVSLADPRFRSTIEAVLDRPKDPHTIGTLAASAGMSRSSFCRQFQTAFGMSPIDFVAKTRLYHAAQLLRSTPLPVKVIAGTVGFSSRSHFSRAFKAAYGTDPTAFRANVAAGAIDPPELPSRIT